MTPSRGVFPSRLVPAAITAPAETSGRWRSAFGSRFFIAIIIGLVWLGPAWWDERFVWAMFGWDTLISVAWAMDWRRLPRPQDLTASRLWFEPLAQAEEVPIALELINRGLIELEVILEDAVPASLSVEIPTVRVRVPAARTRSSSSQEGRARATYVVRPAERGDIRLGPAFIRYQSSFGLAERWASADLSQTVRVYPNLQESRRHNFYLMRSRQIELEKRFKRYPGLGREFESLREYREGDDLREICWTATARRARLISKVYRIERSQTVLIVIDAGRLMLARAGPLPQSELPVRDAAARSGVPAGRRSGHATSQQEVWTQRLVPRVRRRGVAGPLTSMNKLDYAIIAALGLATVALHSGDSVGLLAYGRRPSARLAPGRGRAYLRAMIEQLAVVRGELVEADHARAADLLSIYQKRRSLVVWFTDLAETAATPEVVEAAARLVRRHLVVFVAIGQPELGRLLAARPATVEAMYKYVAAQEMVQRRQLLLRELRQRGVLTLEVTPNTVASAVVNRYLEVKERSLL
jgi:uncharacterized protein (DUF58 family)